MNKLEHDSPVAGASAGGTRHREVVSRLVEITRRYCMGPRLASQSPARTLTLCEGAGLEDRLQASLAAFGRGSSAAVAVAPGWSRAPQRALARTAESPGNRGPEGGIVAWIEFDALASIEPAQAARAADEMRGIVRARIESCAGIADSCLGRYGAESFAWMRTGAMPLKQAVALADAMLESLSAPARLAGANRPLRPSVGFTYFPQDGSSPSLLLTRACAAMRRARHYAMGYAFYSAILDAAFASPVGLALGPAHNARRARRTGDAANSAFA
ncbi:MAG: diguanylate cyclase [Burkholderiaceae bacterium]|nr:diguanylate cyclase [Burkholderiaceae bacterium]